ncbi:MAG: threonylcarbamoyl-AMP synthase [Rhizobiaceae bacterium]|nr:threonylcarbamoyl-AMP synthase [Rhizobiaceae bacterium]
METRIIKAQSALNEALAVLERGGLVAIPTETVYGLSADASNGAGVARIFEAKGRPRFNPLIAHVANMNMARQVAIFDPLSEKLAAAFWPGPLTLVLPLKPGAPVHDLLTAGLGTVAVRMPKGFASELIGRLGRPLAAPSANTSGRISATTAQSVARELGGKVDLIVDGGQAAIGVESTIVKVADGNVLLLRPGGAATRDIERVIGMPVMRGTSGKVEAPGMLLSHYAPNARMRLNADTVNAGEALLAFGPRRATGSENASSTLNLSDAGELTVAASNLFEYMRRLDASGAAVIAVEPIPMDGLGEAINDRLKRAAAPRDGD